VCVYCIFVSTTEQLLKKVSRQRVERIFFYGVLCHSFCCPLRSLLYSANPLKGEQSWLLSIKGEEGIGKDDDVSPDYDETKLKRRCVIRFIVLVLYLLRTADSLVGGETRTKGKMREKKRR